jgi:hypothetical protein
VSAKTSLTGPGSPGLGEDFRVRLRRSVTNSVQTVTMRGVSTETPSPLSVERTHGDTSRTNSEIRPSEPMQSALARRPSRGVRARGGTSRTDTRGVPDQSGGARARTAGTGRIGPARYRRLTSGAGRRRTQTPRISLAAVRGARAHTPTEGVVARGILLCRRRPSRTTPRSVSSCRGAQPAPAADSRPPTYQRLRHTRATDLRVHPGPTGHTPADQSRTEGRDAHELNRQHDSRAVIRVRGGPWP